MDCVGLFNDEIATINDVFAVARGGRACYDTIGFGCALCTACAVRREQARTPTVMGDTWCCYKMHLAFGI